eukprot:TRINITY_DN11085_c0_g1_i1.p1 TRINITY_DN11085_c0_g1~~TRINITY_DN11085_c0_g1_i1.p1  ORF type:complete len:112 (-),score=9.66 TRINITY_DN11085_c0_g1_i1:5-340(-)
MFISFFCPCLPFAFPFHFEFSNQIKYFRMQCALTHCVSSLPLRPRPLYRSVFFSLRLLSYVGCCQINLGDNTNLDHTGDSGWSLGFAVWGQVSVPPLLFFFDKFLLNLSGC